MKKTNFSDKTKTIKLKSKQFETTARINIKDTFDENEITLVEETPEPLPQTPAPVVHEDSVTTKFVYEVTEKNNPARPVRIKETADISCKLKKIEQKIYTDTRSFDLLKKLKDFFSACFRACLVLANTVFLRLTHIKHKKKTAKMLVLTIIVLIAMLGMVSGVKLLIKTLHHKNPAKVLTTQPPLTQPKTQALSLSPLVFSALDETPLNAKAIQAGSSFYLIFNVLDWNTKRHEKLNLNMDIKIYGEDGHLEVFQPDYLSFSKKVDEKKQKIEVKTQINLSPDVALGFYRVIINVTEASTQKISSLQARIKIVP